MRYLLTVLTVCMATSSALAGNSHSTLLGNRAALTGGAVTALTDDGAALWYNPAGLALNNRDQLDLSGSAFVLRIRDYPAVVETRLPGQTERDDLSGIDFLSVPSTLAYVRQLSPDLQLGFGLFVPELDASSVASDINVDAAEFDFRQKIEIEESGQVYFGAVGLGWRVSDTLRVGATLGIFYASGSSDVRLWLDVVADEGSTSIVLIDQQAEASRIGTQVLLGAQLDVSDSITLGLNIRTPALQLYQSVDAERLSVLATVVPTSSEANSDFQSFTESSFTLGMVRPLSATLAGALKLSDGGRLSAEVEFIAGMDDAATSIDTEAQWNARVGGLFPLGESTFFGVGVFTDRDTAKAPASFGDKQVDFYGATVGVDFATPLALRKGAREDGLVFTSTFALRYAAGFGQLGGRIIDFVDTDNEPPARVVDITEHEIALHIGSGLLF